MNIYTSYFTRAQLLDEDGKIYVAISNSVPAWFTPKHIRMKELSPEWSDVDAYKYTRITFKTFEENYKKTLLKRFGSFEAVRQHLMDKIGLTGNQNVVLMCWEKDSKHCHRSILADIFAIDYKGEL